MTIFCDLDGILRKYIPEWKAFKHFMNYKEYLNRAVPIRPNVEYMLELNKSQPVIIATCCTYQYLNKIWLQEYEIDIPLLITGKDKVDCLSKMFNFNGSYLIDDNLEHIKKAERYNLRGIYVPTNSKIPRDILLRVLNNHF